MTLPPAAAIPALRRPRPAFRRPHGSPATMLTVALLAILTLPIFVMFPMVWAQTPEVDRAALVALYDAAGGMNWTTNTGWGTTRPLSEWHGVTTNAEGRVTALELPDNRLVGTLRTELGTLTALETLNLSGNQLEGAIPTSVNGLAALTTLNLSGNRLTGAMPTELGDLTTLVTLDLSDNVLLGGLPDLTSLAALETLDLSDNGLDGNLPNLGSLTTLVTLNLSNNQLTGEIHNDMQRNLDNLQTLNISNNLLTGSISGLTGLEKLVTLDLSNNRKENPDGTTTGLMGTYPTADRGNLPDLKTMKLAGNKLTGRTHLGAQLVTVDLSDNQLTRLPRNDRENDTKDYQLQHLNLSDNNIFAIRLNSSSPLELITGLANLKYLNLSHNEFGVTETDSPSASCQRGPQFCRASPVSIPGMSTGSGVRWDDNLEVLDLSHNQWSGGLPRGLGTVPTKLTTLNLSHNMIDGSIPNLNRLTRLTDLDLSSNELSGELPAEWSALTELATLDLSGGNQLTGALPAELGRLTRLVTLDLSGGNQLEGTLPTELGSFVDLVTLNLSGNRLTGALPTELGGLTKLVTLNISGGNRLTGALPTELGRLVELETLDLNGNQLEGALPTELGGLTKLVTLDLSGNRLTGALPAELGNLVALVKLDLNGNRLTGALPAELASLAALVTLNLGGNQLTGTIPEQLASLAALKTLNLGGNQLTGVIPEQLASLAELVTLNLGGNRLEGAIPEQLASLAELVTLNLSGNQLTGELPEELDNLPALETLDLSDNELEGALPNLGGLATLVTLNLSKNRLTGPIHNDMQTKLNNLQTLNISNNRLTGTINAMSALRGLVTLDLSHNRKENPDKTTTGLTGKYPETGARGFLALPKLRTMKLAGNKLTGRTALSGKLMTVDLSDNLLTQLPTRESDYQPHELAIEHLDLSHNRIQAHIDPVRNIIVPLRWIVGVRKLQTLDLSHNRFGIDGPRPVGIPDIAGNDWRHALVTLDLSHNGWTGLPRGLSEATNLVTLDLSHNQLSGAVPDLSGAAKLKTLNLSHNRQVDASDGSISGGFGGPGEDYDFLNLPAGLTALDLSHNRITSAAGLRNLNRLADLVTLDLSYNRTGRHADCSAGTCTGLWGKALTSLGAMEQLETLDLSRNFMSGAPPGLPTSGNLKQVDFSNNYFDEAIPRGHSLARSTGLEVANYRCNLIPAIEADLSGLVNLWKLDFSCNRLAGELPPWIAKMTSLTDLRFADSRLTGDIPDLSGLYDLDTLRLWGNELTGDVGWLRAMRRLYTVNLHGNQLSGELPDLSGITNLYHLSLQDNQFSGDVSQAALAGLSGLAVLNLSGNAALTGELDLALLDTAENTLDELDFTDTGVTLVNAADGVAYPRLLPHDPPCSDSKPVIPPAGSG